ncbi:sugar phosphate isomerase/epimerase [Paenibacillus sp. YYML68]|uniref:sugar phosphate isomerase/epimerase family protein n=1 Tax=Paenibacillus sp. YYML68 TaxID=2909250 RepID=UPI002491DBAC|nr:sugar phosphate isomerase/epimerase [Paenibacillus sp. YYML68]
MQFGILAHLLGTCSYEELPRRVRAHGFTFVQLALAKAFDGISTKTGALSPGYGIRVAEAFRREGVRIAVLGCYVDTTNADPTLRRQALDRFKEHLRFARDFGASIVAFETGHVSADRDPDDVWAILRGSMQELAAEAERWGVHIGLEPALGHAVDSLDTLERILADVPTANIGVLLDPCNLLHKDNAANQDDIMRRAFEQFGSRMIMAHVKDIAFDADGTKRNVPLGQGMLNLALYMELLRTNKPLMDVTLEQVQPEHMKDALDYLREQGYAD